MKLLLDAHTLLWALYEPEMLPDSLHELLADKGNELFVSFATVWEIANKAAAGRLSLAGSSVDIIVFRMKEFGVVFVPLLLPEIVLAAELPRHHDDPFDRILVAQSQARGFTLVTKDRRLWLYDVPVLWR